MKKLLLLIMLIALSACGGGKTDGTKPVIAVSVPPQKYFAERIVGDAFDVHVMMPVGASPEEYDPTPKDIELLEHAEIYLYLGTIPFEQEWVNFIHDRQGSVTLVNIAEQMPHEMIYGADVAHGHVHIHGDPHYWSSLQGGELLATIMLESLQKEFPEQAEQFSENFLSLKAEFDQINDEAAALFGPGAPAEGATFVIYHPSLSLFAYEMGLEQLVIEENGIEPSPRHIARLLDHAKTVGAKVVFIQQEYDVKQAESIAQSLGIPTVVIQPLEEDWTTEMRRIISAFAL